MIYDVSAFREAVDLTAAGLARMGVAPLVAGDDWSARWQVLAPAPGAVAGVASDGLSTVDLSGALVVLSAVGATSDTPLLSRRSDVLISGLAIGQIVLDDQGTDNGPTGTWGRGWFQLNWSSVDAGTLQLVAGQILDFDIRIQSGVGTVVTYVRGRMEVVKPRTTTFAAPRVGGPIVIDGD